MAGSGMTPEEAAELLRRWQHLGAMILAARQQSRGVWIPAQRLIEAARERLLLERGRLRGLLKRSHELLTPLADPLLTDFGTHRQLAEAREEAYSDWLMWIVEQLETPEYVFRLFGIAEPDGLALCQHTRPTVEREVPVPQGHDNQSGRLDLVVRYAEKALIVVEVKMTDAEEADTSKQRGYIQWMKKQPEPKEHTHSILLVVEAAKEDYHGFTPRRWASLCVALRRIAQTLCREPQRMVLAAMILAFVGAVEQNVLSFSAPLLRHIYSGHYNGQAVKVPSAVGDHIEESLKEGVAYGNTGHR